MNIRTALLSFLAILVLSCQPIKDNSKEDFNIKYNLIEPANGIYAVVKKDVSEREVKDNFYEKLYFDNEQLIRIERYDIGGKLSDNLSVAATSLFEYSANNKVKFLKYYDKENKPAKDKNFGYSSIEYIYDEFDRVRMEIYRDENSEFLEVPRDNSGKIAKVDFLSPVLTYEYLGDKLLIKALDQNFNLLKEVVGDKPCVPFIDCGEDE